MRHAPRRFAGLAILTLAASSAVALQSGWVKVSSAEGRFSAAFPDTPYRMERPVKSDQHTFNVKGFLWMDKSGGLAVFYFDAPMGLPKGYEKLALEAGAQSMRNKRGITVTAEDNFMAGRHHGKRMFVDHGDGSESVDHIILAGRRVYMVSVVAPKGQLATERASRFISSFAIKG